MNKKVFKVCTITAEGEFHSARVGTTNLDIHYKVNERVTPKVGRLLCFDTLENAKAFRLYNEVIFDAMGYGVRREKFLLSTWLDDMEWAVKKLFKSKMLTADMLETLKAIQSPKGTLSASSIKLLKLVV